MDSFHSETLSSDSSSSEPAALEKTKKEVRKRKVRTTEEFAPMGPSTSNHEDSKQTFRFKRQKVSFLPKIDDLMEEDGKATSSTNPPKQFGLNVSAKKTPFKLDKLKIKKKRNKVATPSLSLKKASKCKSPETLHRSRRLPMESADLTWVSEDVEEFRSEGRMSLTLKRDKGGWKSVSSGSSPGYSPKIVFKDLYVSLVPLEKTNLLNEKQLRQLQCKKPNAAASPLVLINSSNHSTPIDHHKLWLGKENVFNRKITSLTKLTAKHLQKRPHRAKSLNDSFQFSDYHRPCNVFLERLSIGQLTSLTSPKENLELGQGTDTNIISQLDIEQANNLEQVTATEVPYINAETNLIDDVNSLNMSTKKPRKSLPFNNNFENGTLELCTKFKSFHPKESSSPMISFKELDYSVAPQDDRVVAKRLTYTYEAGGNNSRESVDEEESTSEVTGCKTLDETYIASSSHGTNGPRSKSIKQVAYFNLSDSEEQESSEDTSRPNKRSTIGKTTSTPTTEGNHGGKRRRSTLTLDESINPISVLKSTCDSNGSPQIIVGAKRRSNNVTLRKHLYAENPQPVLKKTKLSDEQNIDNISPPWGHITYEIEESEMNRTDDCRVLENTYDEASEVLVVSSDPDLDKTSNEEELASILDISSVGSSESSKSTSFTNEIARVTFDKSTKENNLPQKTSALKSTLRKSILKSKNSCASSSFNHRVTFSDMSMMIVEDNDVSQWSPVPTQFPPDDDSNDSVQELSINRRGSRGRSLPQAKKGMNTSLSVNNNTLLGSPVPNRTPQRTKMPNFVKIHQRMYDKMLNLEEHSKKKEKRALALLSGRKTDDVLNKTPSKIKQKQPAGTQIPKLIKFKKQLKFAGESSISKSKGHSSSKKVLLVSSTPKKTQFGFKVTKNVTKADEKMAVANKTKPNKSKKEELKNEIKGVRSNRRFELLMKMRQTK